MKKSIVLIVTVMMILTGVLTGCGNKKYLGEYMGTSGSYLKILDDGTCIYKDGNYADAGAGTWKIEEDEIIVYSDTLGYEIYADIGDKEDDGLMFESDSPFWNNEYFSKQEK